MNSALRRLLVPLLRDVQAGKPLKFRHRSAAGQALFLVQRKPSPSRKAPAQARKLAKAATHREETGAIREAVMLRANHWCEHCGRRPMQLEMDHWLGGWGRRRQQQSVETCWALCGECHEARTQSIPSAAAWNIHFRNHCERYGYSFTPHIEHAPLPEAK